MLADITTTTQS